MNSMTGFGSGSLQKDGRSVAVEIKSVNSRYLDLNFRSARSLFFLEESLRNALSARFGRGKMDISITYKNLREDRNSLAVDIPLALAYRKAVSDIAAACQLQDQVAAAQLARFPQVMELEESEDDKQAVLLLVQETLLLAMDQMEGMRQAEGFRLGEDLSQKCEGLLALVEQIESLAPNVAQTAADRLMERMKEYYEADESLRQRVLAEAAIIADKRAVDEELVRLKSHIVQMKQTLTQGEAIGRKLDFIVQEMNREINTIGSKANDLAIGQLVIQAKSELEKMREQVQNIE